jgi:PleD family two-component response regulator
MAGDEVVTALARLLRHRLIAMAGQAGRLGGPRFGMILPLAAGEAATQIDRLRAAFSSLNHRGRDGGDFHVSFRAGVAEARPGDSAAQLIARAEEKVVS